MVRWNDLFFGSKWQEVVYAQNSSKNHKILGISKTCFHRKTAPNTGKWNFFWICQILFWNWVNVFCLQMQITPFSRQNWDCFVNKSCWRMATEITKKIDFHDFVADFKQIGWKIWLQKIPQRWLQVSQRRFKSAPLRTLGTSRFWKHWMPMANVFLLCDHKWIFYWKLRRGWSFF